MAAVVPPDSLFARVLSRLFLGVPLFCLGIWLTWRGFVAMFRAVTFHQRTCESCGGTGAGSHYVEKQHYGGDGRGTYVERVLVNHCGGCGGTGRVFTATVAGAAFKAVSGVLIANIGGFMVSSLWESGPRPTVAAGTQPPAAQAAADVTASGVPLPADPQPAVPVPADTPPTDIPSTSPAAETVPAAAREIVLSGEERESSGTVWGLRARLQREGQGVHGPLTFQLQSVPPGSSLQSRVNSAADMHVEGTIIGNKLILSGTRVSDPTLIGVGRYELSIDPQAKTFSGTLANGAGTLKGTIENWPAP